MGQAMTSETLCLHGEDGYKYWVGLHAKPFHRGCKKTTYRGVLLGQGARQWEKVTVKAFTNLPNTRENWQQETDNAKKTREMATKFKETFPSGPELTVIPSCLVQMDKVSKVNKWLERRHCYTVLNKDDWVSVEEHVPDALYLYCPWSEWPPWNDVDVSESEHLSTFSHFTYLVTDGQLLICDILATYDVKTGYVITDVTVHSRDKMYGSFDHGESGMVDFFLCHRCTEICKDWPKLNGDLPQDREDDCMDGRRKVHFNLKLDQCVFPRSALKNRLPVLRRHASDEGAKLRKKWMDRVSRDSQLHPLVATDGPPPYEESVSRHESIVDQRRVKSWTISELSCPDLPDVNSRSRDTTTPIKSCLKRTTSDQYMSTTSRDM
uniref:Alpha-type protein kinase domain-containing protein n=1 Tax=Biomphalaria glabrata TaxID=6526 RepID=A0A2C9LEU9_BIOGL